jgi:hypothetical protein
MQTENNLPKQDILNLYSGILNKLPVKLFECQLISSAGSQKIEDVYYFIVDKTASIYNFIGIYSEDIVHYESIVHGYYYKSGYSGLIPNDKYNIEGVDEFGQRIIIEGVIIAKSRSINFTDSYYKFIAPNVNFMPDQELQNRGKLFR